MMRNLKVIELLLAIIAIWAHLDLDADAGPITTDKDKDIPFSEVIELTDTNFEEFVMQSDEPWLVNFFAPWCGQCKRLEPEYATAAKALKGKVNLGALDATVHESKANEYNVYGYPTILYFPRGKKSVPTEYDGGQTSESIANWTKTILADSEQEQIFPVREIVSPVVEFIYKMFLEL